LGETEGEREGEKRVVKEREGSTKRMMERQLSLGLVSED
jgi:hypothetical protein